MTTPSAPEPSGYLEYVADDQIAEDGSRVTHTCDGHDRILVVEVENDHGRQVQCFRLEPLDKIEPLDQDERA